MTMNKFKLALAAFALLLAFPIHPVRAQGLDPQKLLQPPTDTWPTYNGDYSGRRYSTLDQINSKNVSALSVAWAFPLHGREIKSTPLVVNGVMYFSTPDNVWAIDARYGKRIWHYERKSEGDHIGHRGLAMYKDWLYFTTPDAQLVSLNAKDGKVRWIIEIGDPKLGYFATMAPLVVKDHVVVGVSGDMTDIPGFLKSVDPETGKLQWIWYTQPKPGEPGSETWPKDSDAIHHGGGMTWMTGTYDPGLNLLYWGTGNPNPVLVGDGRLGDNLYTCTIVALDADTGKLKWYFQPSPHDVHDWDATQTPVLFDAPFNGKPRKLLAQAARNGFFFVLDRATGEHLITKSFIEQTWSSGIDERGRPIAKPDATPTPDGALVAPSSDGSTNWMAPSFSLKTNLFYVNARRIFSVYYRTGEGKAEGWGGRDRFVWANSALRALDYKTGDVVWTRELGDDEHIAGILTTAGNLLFTADLGDNLLALDPANGKTLWHINLGEGMAASPMTYEIDGRQFVIMPVGSVLYAFALPESVIASSAPKKKDEKRSENRR